MKLGKKRLGRTLGCRGGMVVAAMLVGVSGASPVWAQTKSQPDKKLKKEGEKLFGPGRGGEQKPGETTGDSVWSIMIEGFRGDDQAEAARVALERVQTKGGLPEA